MPYLDKLGFNLVGYGCTTCIGNSGPLPEPIADAVEEGDLVVAAVLSGNRNFEGRVNPHVNANYLASPPLVVAYALAGTINIDLINDPIGTGNDGQPVYLKDIWPTNQEIAETIQASLTPEMFRQRYSNVFAGPTRVAVDRRPRPARPITGTEGSTYVKLPPLLRGHEAGAGAGLRRPRRPSARHPGRLDHDRPHLPGRLDQEEQPGRRISDGAIRSARRTSTPTAPAAATTKS